MKAADGVMGIDWAVRPWLPALIGRVTGQLDLDAVEILEHQRVDAEARGPGELDIQAAEAPRPELERSAGDRERDHGHLPASRRPPRQVRPAEKRHGAAWSAEVVAEVDVVGVGDVEVDGLLDEAKAEYADVEVDILLNVARDACDVVNSGNVGGQSHRLLPSRTKEPNVSPYLEYLLPQLLVAVVLRGFVLDPAPDLRRQWLACLLLDVCDQADRAGHDGDASPDLPRDLELAQDGADRAGGVDGQLAPIGPAGLFGDELHQLDVASLEAVLLGDRE